MNIRKGCRLVLLMLIISLVLIGCSADKTQTLNSSLSPSAEPQKTSAPSKNPFETDGENQVILGRMSHRFANPKLDQRGQRAPMAYNGGEMKIDYQVAASGKANNVGFLIFINGQPQPYKFNSTETPYEYMHIFEVPDDDENYTPFTFVFTPITGKKGDQLSINIISVYNPGFTPDMKETSSYGGYQTTLQLDGIISFNTDPKPLDDPSIMKQEVLSDVRQTTEPITQELLEKASGFEKVDLNALDKKVYNELQIDGDVRMDNYSIEGKDKVHVTFKLFGHPGVQYRSTFYINHQAISAKKVSFETKLTKGNVSVIKADIEVEKLEDFNTFYVVSAPLNANDFPDDVIILDKTASVLLYKGKE